MKSLKRLPTIMSVMLALACFLVSVSGQTTDEKNRLANVSAGGAGVRWDVYAQNAGLTITVSIPDGQVYRKEFRSDESPEFPLTDKQGNRMSDGQYTYELRLTPVISAEVKKELAAGREKGGDDDAALEREMRKRGQLPTQPLIQSGTFSIVNGAVVIAGGVESEGGRAASKTTRRSSQPSPLSQSKAFSNQAAAFFPAHAVEAASPRAYGRMTAASAFAHPAFPDDVIPDDLIVQGSACVGLDCVNGESFGFDTIRMKENNTRIKFEDTSVGSFPSNDWQLTANDSASGGANKFSIEDVTGSKVPFTITAGAATNSIFVDSTGRLGLRTSTPVLDIHAATSNTPALRFEQNNSGGFTAQTWDVAGNEANFFVRDVTSGSRLPFRIRPGAPTSSIDISASGNVGIGTASPANHLHVLGTGIQTIAVESTQNGNNAQFSFIGKTSGGTAQSWFLGENIATQAGNFEIYDNTAGQNRFLIDTTGNVGIGTTAPTDKLSVNGSASKPGGGSWSVFSDERLKNIKGPFSSGLKAVMQLQPLRYEYRQDNALGLNSPGEHVGFGAQAVQKIIPEAVTRTGSGYLVVNNDPIIWTMLNAIKEQQKEIEQLKAQIQQLRPRAGTNGKVTRRRHR